MSKNNGVIFIILGIILIVWIFIFALILKSCSSHLSMPLETHVFRKYVLKPIPESVSDIKVDTKSTFSGYMHLIYFKINKTDVQLIIDSREFIKIKSVRYENNNLYFGDINEDDDTLQKLKYFSYVRNLPLYPHSNKIIPEWFDVNSWENPQVYMYRMKFKKSDTYRAEILIYNEELGEAYFIEDLSKY